MVNTPLPSEPALDLAIAPSWKAPELTLKQRFGMRLYSLRADRGLTQMQVAERARRDRSFISDMERGIKEPSLTTLDSLAKLFSMSVSELLRDI